VADLNILLKFVTAVTFHDSIVPLKADADSNIDSIVVTLAVFHALYEVNALDELNDTELISLTNLRFVVVASSNIVVDDCDNKSKTELAFGVAGVVGTVKLPVLNATPFII
jgi:hypothetical protein